MICQNENENINATTFPDKVKKQIKIINKSTLNNNTTGH